MFSTVFIDISLIFAQLGLENFGKTVRDPLPFYYLHESKYQKIILQWGANSIKSNIHWIFPYLVGITPHKFKFVYKDCYFHYFLAFLAG